jgi:two-component system sensor histidine kinase DesK
MPIVWLVYFVPFLVYPALVHASPAVWLATAAGAVTFLALYFWGYQQCGRRILWSVAGIALLAAVFAPWNLWSSTFWVFAAAFLGVAGRPAFAARCLAVLLVAIGVESWLLHLPTWYWVPALVFTALIGGIKIHYSEVRRADASLRLAHEEVERLAKVAERERIGRDLHDLLGHTLTLITLKAELAGKLVSRDPAAAAWRARGPASPACASGSPPSAARSNGGARAAPSSRSVCRSRRPRPTTGRAQRAWPRGRRAASPRSLPRRDNGRIMGG